MKWVADGLTLIFLGVLVGRVSAVADGVDSVVRAVYIASAGMLVAIGACSGKTT